MYYQKNISGKVYSPEISSAKTTTPYYTQNEYYTINNYYCIEYDAIPRRLCGYSGKHKSWRIVNRTISVTRKTVSAKDNAVLTGNSKHSTRCKTISAGSSAVSGGDKAVPARLNAISTSNSDITGGSRAISAGNSAAAGGTITVSAENSTMLGRNSAVSAANSTISIQNSGIWNKIKHFYSIRKLLAATFRGCVFYLNSSPDPFSCKEKGRFRSVLKVPLFFQP